MIRPAVSSESQDTDIGPQARRALLEQRSYRAPCDGRHPAARFAYHEHLEDEILTAEAIEPIEPPTVSMLWAVARSLRRIVGKNHGTLRTPSCSYRVAAALIISCVPVIATMVFDRYVLATPASWWLIYFAAFNFLLLSAADIFWRGVQRQMCATAQILHTPLNQRRIKKWILRAVRRDKQWATAMIGAVLGVSAVIVLDATSDVSFEIGIASGWSVAVTSFVGMNGIYGAIVIPRLMRQIAEIADHHDLNVTFPVPANTKAIHDWSYFVVAQSILAPLSVGLLGGPIVFAASTGTSQTPATLGFLAIGGAVTATLLLATLPHYWLRRVVITHKSRYAAHWATSFVSEASAQDQHALQQTLRAVEDSPNSPVGWILAGATAAAVAIAGPLLAWAFRWVSGTWA